MGGKRPDQYQIDGGEAGSTDYKRLRQDEGIKEQEKHELTQQGGAAPPRDERERETPIPQPHENPVQAEVRARHDRERDDDANR